MNISLPETMKGFIDTQLKTGGYGSMSEYVRELIRKDQIAKVELQLRDMLLEGLNSGLSTPADAAFFDSLESKVKALRIAA